MIRLVVLSSRGTPLWGGYRFLCPNLTKTVGEEIVLKAKSASLPARRFIFLCMQVQPTECCVRDNKSSFFHGAAGEEIWIRWNVLVAFQKLLVLNCKGQRVAESLPFCFFTNRSSLLTLHRRQQKTSVVEQTLTALSTRACECLLKNF